MFTAYFSKHQQFLAMKDFKRLEEAQAYIDSKAEGLQCGIKTLFAEHTIMHRAEGVKQIDEVRAYLKDTNLKGVVVGTPIALCRTDVFMTHSGPLYFVLES